MKRVVRCTISAAESGLSVVALLSSRFTYRTQAGWVEELARDRLLRNGVPASADEVVSEGDVLEYVPPAISEPAVETDYSIIFEDQALLAINKPPSLPCHPAGRYFAHTLWALLREARPEGEVHFVNRLDRETSGIVLIGKTREATRRCRQQFARGDVEKRYLAVVHGDFACQVAAVGYLVPDRGSAVRKKQCFVSAPPDGPIPPKAKRVTTRFEPLRHRGGLSLVQATPLTGRYHQIRATLHDLGFPIVGDKLYGVDETLFLRFAKGCLTADDRSILRLSHQALHAADLCLTHPATGEALELSAALPEDMRCLVRSDEDSVPTAGPVRPLS